MGGASGGSASGGGIDRRRFLGGVLITGTLAACTAGGATDPAESASGPVGTPEPSPTPTPSPSRPEVLGVAVIGAGGHGRKLARRLARDRRVRVLAICDPDSARAREVAGQVEALDRPAPERVADLRRVLDDPRIQAVAIATPHHWHAVAAVWALQAGKHVYLEKPATHHLAEGPALLAAWQGSGLVVEVGTQRRSHPGLQEAIAALHAGEIGDVALARCFSWKRRGPIGPQVRGTWPATLDPELWFGPRPVTRPTRERFHYDWHWFTDFGNGGLGNNGVHRLDVARWGMGLSGIGDQVLSVGGRLGEPDSGQTPNTALTVVAFGDRAVVHDLRGLASRPGPGMQDGDEVMFLGDGASIVTTRIGGRLVGGDGRTVRRFGTKHVDADPITRHLKGFVSAVLAGDPSAVAVGPEEGVGAAAMCHAPAAAHADALGGDASPLSDVADQVEALCGPGMAEPTRNFLAHARAQRGEIVASGTRAIDSVEVVGAPEDFDTRRAYRI